MRPVVNMNLWITYPKQHKGARCICCIRRSPANGLVSRLQVWCELRHRRLICAGAIIFIAYLRAHVSSLNSSVWSSSKQRSLLAVSCLFIIRYINKPTTITDYYGQENGLLTVRKDMARCSTANPLCSSGLFTLTWMQSHSRSLNWGSATPHVLICVLVMKRMILFSVWSFYFNYNNVPVSGSGSCAAAPTAQRDFSSSIEYGGGSGSQQTVLINRTCK